MQPGCPVRLVEAVKHRRVTTSGISLAGLTLFSLEGSARMNRLRSPGRMTHSRQRCADIVYVRARLADDWGTETVAS
jgi:hypothetical protein